MKTSFTILFYFYTTILLAQNHAAINRAELLLCSKNFEAAGNLYDSLVREDNLLLSQDFFNAAMCHILNQNVASSKSYIQKLALRGVPLTELEPLKKHFSPTEWQSIEISYQQLVESSVQDNVFTQFQEEMEERFNKPNPIVQEAYSNTLIYVYSEKDSSKYVYRDRILRKINKSFDIKLYEKLSDSVFALPENQTNFQILFRSQNDLFGKFIQFIQLNGFPSEDQLNQNQLNILDNPFWKLTSSIIYNLNMETSELTAQQRYLLSKFSLPDSVNRNYFQILEQKLTQAVGLGNIKARQQLKLLYPSEYQNLSNINSLLVFTEKGNCTIEPNKAVFYYRHQNLHKKLPHLESQEDFGRKYMFQVEHPDLFYFMETVNPEHAYFDSCQAAKEYLESKKLVH